jgi:hypothetical protein
VWTIEIDRKRNEMSSVLGEGNGGPLVAARHKKKPARFTNVAERTQARHGKIRSRKRWGREKSEEERRERGKRRKSIARQL